MRRRELITFLCGVIAWVTAAEAQRSSLPVIGVLSSQSKHSEAARLTAIREGLKDAGFVDGQNVTFEYRFADGQNSRLPVLADELIGRHVNVLVANTVPPAIAAKAATSTIPIVFALGADPVKLGLVASFNRPGGNVTGVAFQVNELVGKRLELLCEAVPGAMSLGMVADPNNPNYAADTTAARSAAEMLGRTLHVENVAAHTELDAALATLIKQKIGALFVAPEANFRIWRNELVAAAMRYGLPSSYSSRDFVTVGGMMSYGPDQLDLYRQAGVYAGRVLKGEKPADMPVVQPTKFELVVNLKTVRALGLTLPQSLLARTDDVIE